MTQSKDIPGSIVLGSASGGAQGNGSINAKSFFQDGVEVESNNPLDRYFNPSNTKKGQIRLTTTNLTNVYQYTGTGRAVITGITACNISGNGGVESEISAVVNDSSLATDFSIANRIPVPAGTSDDLIKRPKVLEPNDLLKMQAVDADVFDVTVTIAEYDNNSNLFNAFLATGSSAESGLVSIYDETNANGSAVESILLTSIENGINGTLVDLAINDGTTDYFLTFDLNVPEKTTVEVCEKPKHIPNGGSIKIQVSEADKIIVHASGRTL